MSRLIAAVSMRQPAYFLAVAEANGFRQAAEALRISQPPLSQQMKALPRWSDHQHEPVSRAQD